MFPLFATGVSDTGGKFAAGVIDIGDNVSPVSLTPVANLPSVTTTPEVLVAKFAANVVDTGGAPCLTNIFVNFWKNSK